MADDFMVDEEESNGSSNRRSFLAILGLLSLIFIAAMICNFTLLNRNRDTDFAAESTAIALQNIDTMTRNAEAAATWTAEAEIQSSIDATNEAQPQPTEVPDLEPTNTEVVEETPEATNTAIVKSDETATPNLSGTSEFGSGEGDGDGDGDGEDGDGDGDGDGGDEDSSTPDAVIGGDDGTATPISGNGGDQGALPDTGFNTWGTIVVGLVLAGILIGARRVRQL